MKKFVPSFQISANKNTDDKQAEHVTNNNDFDAAETIRPIENENLKPNYLPPGYKITDFPKYTRIQGFDKRNPVLK